MLAPSRARLLERVLASATRSSPSCPSIVALPGFLVPAFQTRTPPAAAAETATATRSFSATASRPSKLGRTPISIPPGVELTIGEPFVKKDATTYLRIPKRKVTVSGPLGSLDLEVEPFINIDYDATARMAMLSVQDQSLKKQKEMWGGFAFL